MNVPSSFRYVIILVLMCVHKSITAPTTTSSEATSSASCTIDTSNTTLDCSNLGLTEIPNDIPNSIITLKMSFNNLVHLTEETFGECCRHLNELDLSNNEISNIDKNAFKNFDNLTKLILRKNKLSEFDPETFKEVKNLESIDLSYNSIKLSNSFIVHNKLKEILLDYCDIDEISNDAFARVKQLESLSLEGNSLDNFDATAFEHIDQLTSLRMHNLSKESIIELCGVLLGIDTINFDGFNISCYMLSSGSKFEDAIVYNDKPIELPVYHQTTTTLKPTTTTTLALMTTTGIPALNHTGGETSKIPEPVTIQTTTTTEVNSAVVDVDSETIKYMLIGILAVTTVGIAIGLVCRADVCNIKTKLCRSNKNRARKPEDSVSPFEEIPLNTVNSNGNGKTTNSEG